MEVSKPLVEKPAQYGNDDQSQEENDESTDRIHGVDVVLVEPLDDLVHADLGPHADKNSLTHHQIRPLLCVRAKPMSALGQKRTFGSVRRMSALFIRAMSNG